MGSSAMAARRVPFRLLAIVRNTQVIPCTHPSWPNLRGHTDRQKETDTKISMSSESPRLKVLVEAIQPDDVA